jgi:hypothetical protein
MAVMEPSPTAPDEQATARPAPPVSPVQSRLRAMEIATRLLLLASVAVFAWAALSVFIRPFVRTFIEEPHHTRVPLDPSGGADLPTDFYQPGDEDDGDSPPRGVAPHRQRIPDDDNDDDDDRKNQSKVQLVPGTVRKDAKLYGEPSERSAEIGEVRAGESIFVMKEATSWVLVLRGEGAMLGWMRRDNLGAR